MNNLSRPRFIGPSGGIVALVGRPNVGKSTIFNRIHGHPTAIVEEVEGVTRDRHYEIAEWSGHWFTLVDTGGLLEEPQGGLQQAVRKQAEEAIQHADVTVFVVDGTQGITPEDQAVAQTLRRAGKKVILAVNKIDNFSRSATQLADFYELGMGDPVAISAAHGLNIDELLDRVMDLLPGSEGESVLEDREHSIKIAVVGRPNVGKSSLVNRVAGEERVIVAAQPGTTRDAIDIPLQWQGQTYVLVDTAGMRRKARVEPGTERYSVVRALRAIDRSDAALLVLDASLGVTEQDMRLAGYIHEAGKASLVVVNKWDLVENKEETAREIEARIREKLPFMPYLRMVLVSARTGRRVVDLLRLAGEVVAEASRRIGTPALNKLVRESLLVNPPPQVKGRRLQVYYVTQVGIKPPSFVFFVNDPDLVHFSYTRHLENQLRQAYSFPGTPIRIIYRHRN